MSKSACVPMHLVRRLLSELRLAPTIAVGILAAIIGMVSISSGNWVLIRHFPSGWARAAGLDLGVLFSCPTTSIGPSSTSQHRASADIQVFSLDPLVLYIHNFVSQDEISHLLNASVGKFEPSRVWWGADGEIDPQSRISDTAILDSDDVTEQIKQRALRIQGWKGGKSTYSQPLRAQRYGVGGFYTFHYDWDKAVKRGNRVATLMVYLVGNCSGGGTNFPELQRPDDARWCEVVDCDDGDYEGVTFKPTVGAAVYWENMHPNGSFHMGVEHAALPVKSGEKVGLNIWLWDPEWTPPPGEAERLIGAGL
ncbi:putative prolyl 4-hydroxylase alpha subunit [Lasiosphaeria hispida]|uniref:Prolyl 4-hydroxylase alpha subunit n=1 Tax=Lasiosphaeria hispida TaxID=260671 RepID=A0AAJ0HDK8_9PEZI|nr:putative prolyl 4-hydroxylase alpha subunit [Lasiosphaeria hispida]